MIFRHFDLLTSMLVAGLFTILYCGVISFLGWRSIKAIPVENLRERLACVVQYAFSIPFLLFMYQMLFQPSFLGEPTEFDTPQRLLKTYYTQIESIETAQNTLNYALFFGAVTILHLLSMALRDKN